MPVSNNGEVFGRGEAIQFGCANKTEVSLTVRFPTPFDEIPVVVVSPVWENARRGVGHAETIDSVTRESFTVFSSNAAGNYFVSWMAAGKKDRE